MFRTELPLVSYPHQLPHAARVLTVGSCFAETIGARLVEHKVAAVVNPFGIVFNPLTACQLLRAAAGEDMDWQQHLVEARGRWQSYDLHATIGADSPVTLLQQIQELVQQTGEFLRTANVVVLTLGTAFVYRLRATGELVSNCHKISADQFEKELLTPDEIINAVAETHAYLRRHNPQLRFILTVSPVRHLKDTLPLNAVSKSALRLACHYLSELLPDVSYFPAYELLLDDLRDYRFYADDMLHPSTVAQEYIWERFTRTYFDAAFGRFKKEWHSLRQALNHRPLYAAAPEHRQFLEATLERLRRLSEQVDVAAEMDAVEQQLLALPLPPAPTPAPEPEDDEERIDIGEYATTIAPAESVAVVGEEAMQEEMPESLPSTPVASEPELVVDEIATPLPKKKRRSRGGAKRTARKRAALEALAAQEADLATQSDTDPSVTETTLLPTPEAVYESVVVAEPVEAEAVEATISTHAEAEETDTAQKPRKGRTAGQILADKKKARRSGKNRGRQLAPLYATPDMVSADNMPEEGSEQLSEEAIVPVLLSETAPTPAPSPTPPNTEEHTASVPAATTSPTTVPEPVASSPVAPELPTKAPESMEVVGDGVPPVSQPETEAIPTRKTTKSKAPAKPRASRSKKAPAAPVPTDATAPEPVATPDPAVPKPKQPRKKAAKSPSPAAYPTPQPSIELPVADTAPASETLPTPPKRRTRPARKKPATPDDTPAT
ncbi:GSCFA domain-containing protein [Hymenobacter aerilatus]|uniref:GSCFA domain-containing protein n=1 Tax=Hymenobacter aerilatus TaxID=2932251 RepID=A0A8T9SWE1_9BACT|nr:GSCFA domain-containing protein [Hymenobacter aerilatus]UOR05721.1 GSCFA domain-containing protein [Hymenobacter aerilatus]